VRCALLLSLSFSLVFGAFAADPVPDAPPPPPATVYQVKGVIQEILPSGKVRIAHEAIPNYMEAMTMEFSVPEARELEGLRAGDAVSFRLLVTIERGWIDHLRKIAEAPAIKPVAPPRPVATVGIGDMLPDCTLIDQAGRPLRLRDFRGKALTLTFIFTRCPMPDFCPLVSRRMKTVQQALSAKDLATNWNLLSITIDPEYDTPERMAAYATGLGADLKHWSFATGKVKDIEALGGAFGLYVDRKALEIDHNMRTVVVDPDGRVRQIFTGNDWQDEELIDEMKRATAEKQ
jgi:protein SCO1/2